MCRAAQTKTSKKSLYPAWRADAEGQLALELFGVAIRAYLD